MTHHFIYAIVGIGWLAFIAYWLFMATKAKRGRGALRSYSYFVVYRLIVFGLILAVILSTKHNGKYGYGQLEFHSLIIRLVGLIVFIAGLSFAVWARVHLSENWGMPMSRHDEPKLIVTGPYKYVRHPIYTGMLLGMLGTALAVSLYWILALVAVGAYFIYSAKQEEKYMLQLFGAKYKDYKKSSKFLIPFV